MPNFKIDISDLHSQLSANDERLRNIIERVLLEERISSADISLALVDDAEIHRINREFLGHDYPTDVISFVLGDPSQALPREHLEGELVVSAETAIREASAHGWSAADELLLYVVHGLLHLCGYDDLTDEDRPVMRSRERQVLSYWQLMPTGLEA